MFAKKECGVSRVVLSIIGVGVLAVGGTLLLLGGGAEKGPIKPPPTVKPDQNTASVVTDIKDSSAGKEELSNEEEPTLIHTVDKQGKTRYIGTKQTTIYMPGKGERKMYKIATALGRKMKPLNAIKPEAVKLVHPAVKKGKSGGKVEVQGTGAEGGGSATSSAPGSGGDKGGKANKGKGPGGAGGGTGGK